MSKKKISKKSKTDLILAVQEMLRNQSIGTQEEIGEALQKQGFSVNQVGVSRLLHKIGAIKMSDGNQIVYRLPTELVNLTAKDPLKQLILSIDHNETLIVIQTAPGSAQLVARLLDLKNQLGILGTVAGDDTIFVAPSKASQIKTVYQKISNLLLI